MRGIRNKWDICLNIRYSKQFSCTLQRDKMTMKNDNEIYILFIRTKQKMSILHKFPTKRHAMSWCHCRRCCHHLYLLTHAIQRALYHRSRAVWICINIISLVEPFALLACHTACIARRTSKFLHIEKSHAREIPTKMDTKIRGQKFEQNKTWTRLARIELSTVYTVSDDNRLLALCSMYYTLIH